MKENKNMVNQKSTNSQLLILLESTAYQQEFYFTSELFFFLLQYSFLFKDNDKTQKTCTLKTAHFHIPQGNGEKGARYLDPKYSRWLSTDPALSSYIGRDYEGPSGGIYNSVNLNLYHYGGNNPIRYLDPDGREDDYFTSTTYDKYEIAISEVQNYIRENYNGKEFAGLIEVNNKGNYFFKIKEGEEGTTTWGYALMESDDELKNVMCDFHSHPSLTQEYEEYIKHQYPNSTNINISLEFGNLSDDGEILSGFFYVAVFLDEGYKRTRCRSSAISTQDIDASRSHPNKPSLVFSSDFDEYCIIINGQIIYPTNKIIDLENY